MRIKTWLLVGAAAASAAAFVAPDVAAAQARQNTYRAPRILDNRPDLQGVWTNVTVTPLQRPAALGNRRAMTEEEVREREGRAIENVNYENLPTDPSLGAEDHTRKNCNSTDAGGSGAGGRDCGYNAGWKDSTITVMRVGGEPRTSFITFPENGRIPPRLGGAAGQRAAAREAATAAAEVSENSAAPARRGQNDNPETRGLAERCIAFGNTAGPIMPNGYYNNNIRIVQGTDSVAILLEMVHDVRLVRLNDTHRTDGVRPWFGDSVGRYEGDTLVVTTRNYHPMTSYQGSSENMVLEERFTRVAPDRLLYQFKITDPDTWAQPWGGEYEFYPTQGDIYEYACHEGNYGLENILAGARHEEEEARLAAAQRGGGTQ